MVSPTSPTPPTGPQGYSSQINPGDVALTKDLKEHLSKLVDRLHHIQSEVRGPHPHIENIIADLNLSNEHETNFLKDLKSKHNPGHENAVKSKYEGMHHEFTDKLNDITNPEGDSLRDALLSYDPGKLSGFLKDLSQSPQAMDSLRLLGSHAEAFAQSLSSSFQL